LVPQISPLSTGEAFARGLGSLPATGGKEEGEGPTIEAGVGRNWSLTMEREREGGGEGEEVELCRAHATGHIARFKGVTV
jgi:hypothetical protein